MVSPLWGIAVLVTWTIFAVLLLLGVRLRLLASGADPSVFGKPDEGSLVWRLLRVQYNLIENLPLFIRVAVLLLYRQVHTSTVDLFVAIYIIFRITHSLIHMFGLNPKLRLACLLIQLGSLLALIYLGVTYVDNPSAA